MLDWFRRTRARIICTSVAIGILITIISGFIVNNNVSGEFPNIIMHETPLMGTVYWGFPLPTHKLIVYPSMTRQPIMSNFIIDVIYWSALVLIIESLIRLRGMVIRVKEPKSTRVRRKKTAAVSKILKGVKPKRTNKSRVKDKNKRKKR